MPKILSSDHSLMNVGDLVKLSYEGSKIFGLSERDSLRWHDEYGKCCGIITKIDPPISPHEVAYYTVWWITHPEPSDAEGYLCRSSWLADELKVLSTTS
jgi:hypothetical protein